MTVSLQFYKIHDISEDRELQYIWARPKTSAGACVYICKQEIIRLT